VSTETIDALVLAAVAYGERRPGHIGALARAREALTSEIDAYRTDLDAVRGEVARLQRIERMAAALMARDDFWLAVRRTTVALPGEYDDVMDALKGVGP
jgi:hypothetical protein